MSGYQDHALAVCAGGAKGPDEGVADRIGSVAAIYNALVPDYRAFGLAGETRFILVVATRLDQAREFVRYVREMLQAASDKDIASLLDEKASTLDEIVLRNGVVIRAMPCSSGATRGLTASMVILDELARFEGAAEGIKPARTVWRAITPNVSPFGAMGHILVTSTPL